MKPLFIFIALLLAVFLLYPVVFIFEKTFIVEGSFSVHFAFHAFTDPSNLELLLRSLNLALTATCLAAIISIPAAIVMSTRSFFGRGLLQMLLLFPLILPPFVGAVGLKQVFARFGPLNLILMDLNLISRPVDFLGGGGFTAVALTQALHLFPILYLNLSAALSSRDQSLEEAARCAGASWLQILRRITLPLALPGFFAGSSIVFIWSFTDIGTPLIFRFEQLLPVVIYNLRDQVHENPAGYALSLMTLAVSALIFILGRRISGAGVSGSAKGTPRTVLTPLSPLQNLLVLVPAGAIICAALLPHAGVLLLSLSDQWSMTILPERMSLSAYTLVFSHPLTVGSIRNSLVLSFASTLFDIFLGISIAWIVCRTKIPGRKILDVVCMLPLAVPGVILAFAYLGAFSGTFMDPRHNPFPLLIIGYAMRRLPFMLRAVTAGLQQANITLEEAAFMSGAGRWHTFRRINLPLLFPHIAAGAVLSFAFAMLEVSESLLLAMEDRFYPLTKAMYVLLARPDGLSLASALGILGMALTALSLIIAAKALGKDLSEIFRL